MVEAYVHDAVGAYRAVRRWIAPSRFVLEKAVELGADRTRVRLVPHGVEPGVVAAASASVPQGAPIPDGRYVLFAGRLAVEKGVRLLPALAMRIAPVPLVVAGGGPLEGWLATQAAGLPGLRLLGHRGAAEVRSLVQGAAVVIVPSLFYETYCYAAAEALLEARPVVAARIGAIPELVEHEVTGLLAPPGDAHALAEAVGRALEDPAAARWGETGRARLLEAGAPARHVEGLTAVYREAMDRR